MVRSNAWPDIILTAAESYCTCADGDDCYCGKKSDGVEVRMARSLARPSMPVKSKSAVSVVETKMTQFANGHHKPVHRNNISAHISGAPYSKPRRTQRPQSAHVDPFDASMDDYDLDLLSRSADDVTFLRLSALMPHMSVGGATSDAVLESGAEGPPADDYIDFDKHFFSSGDARFGQAGGAGSNYASTRGSPPPQQSYGAASSMAPGAAAVASPNFDAGDDMYPIGDYFNASSDAAGLALVTASLQQHPGLAHSDGSAPPTGSPASLTDEAWAAASAEFAAPPQASDPWDGSGAMSRSAADVKGWTMLPPASAAYPGAGPQLAGLFDAPAGAGVLGVPALAGQTRPQQLLRQEQQQSPLPFKNAARLMTPPAAVVDSPPRGYVLMRRPGGGGGGLTSGLTSASVSNLDEDEVWGDARVAGLDGPAGAAPLTAGGDGSLWNTYSWLMDDDAMGRR
jgi:hypothetical protein